jgi:hypothetical protein
MIKVQSAEFALSLEDDGEKLLGYRKKESEAQFSFFFFCM